MNVLRPGPLAAALAALVAVFLKERISRRAILGAALAVAGVAILASRA